jgi:hypothetical protein
MGGLRRDLFSSQRVLAPWGSQSTSAGIGPVNAKYAAIFVDSDVFPQPPFGFNITIRCGSCLLVPVPIMTPRLFPIRGIHSGLRVSRR